MSQNAIIYRILDHGFPTCYYLQHYGATSMSMTMTMASNVDDVDIDDVIENYDVEVDVDGTLDVDVNVDSPSQDIKQVHTYQDYFNIFCY